MIKRNLVGLLACAMFVFLAGCGGEDLDSDLFGYWIECDGTGAVYLDEDAYGWGFEINDGGELTTARLDYNAEQIQTEANGPFGRLLSASKGKFKVEIDGEGTDKGNYSITQITSNAGGVFPMLTISGTAAAGNYLKLAEL